jgi:hypothetical protein
LFDCVFVFVWSDLFESWLGCVIVVCLRVDCFEGDVVVVFVCVVGVKTVSVEVPGYVTLSINDPSTTVGLLSRPEISSTVFVTPGLPKLILKFCEPVEVNVSGD